MAGGPRRRFTLLFLDEVDHYLDDHGANLLPDEELWRALGHVGGSGPPPPLKGRLRVSTRALFFEADDVLVPILRFQFVHVRAIEAVEHAHTARISCDQFAELYPDAPFVFRKGKWAACVQLLHSALDSVLPVLDELRRIAHSPDPEAALDAIADARVASFAFDYSWLSDLASEKVVCELRARRITPLVSSPGILVLTDRCVYFQCMHPVDSEPQQRWPLEAVCAVERRRHLLQQTALEISSDDARSPQQLAGAGVASKSEAGLSGGPGASATMHASVLFALDSEAQRELLARHLVSLSTDARRGRSEVEGVAPPDEAPRDAARELADAQAAWMCGALSNFDYLLALNSLAGRTMHDWNQYPVLPWVLTDYTSPHLDLSDPACYRDLSKPIGALTPARLARFRERYRESALAAAVHDSSGGAMLGGGSSGQDDAAHSAVEVKPFMYGTHYSSAGFVLHYLVRLAPELMLRLQNGRFDDPQRLFQSVADTWHGVTHSSSDVKELIPEFFSGDGAFLLNGLQLPLGTRANGERVGHVQLPTWAHSSADFVRKSREALDSEVVSARLHSWIDLVFGAAQTGEAAVAADNVFFHLTYEGAVDLSSIGDKRQRRALELQVAEFGQTPTQLWTGPHPRRRCSQLPLEVSSRAGSEDKSDADVPEPASQPRSEPQPGLGVGSRLLARMAAAPWLPRWAVGSGVLRGSAADSSREPPAASPGAGAGRAAAASSAAAFGAAVTATAAPRAEEAPETARGGRGLELRLVARMRSAAPPRAAAASPNGRELFVCDIRGQCSLVALGARGPSERSEHAASEPIELSARTRVVCAASLTAIVCCSDGSRGGDGSGGCVAWVGSADCQLRCIAPQTQAQSEADAERWACAASVRAHDGPISCLALLPCHAQAPGDCAAPGGSHGGGGSRLLSGSWDRTVKVWDLAAGSGLLPLCTLGEHDSGVSVLACLGPGSELAASGAEDGSLTLWDPRCSDANCRNLAPEIGPVSGLAFVDGGRYLLSCCSGLPGQPGVAAGSVCRLRLLSAADGREIASEPLRCAAECLLVVGSTVLVGLTDGGVRVSSWSSTGIGGAHGVVSGSCAPIVAMASAGSVNTVSVIAADGAIQHYSFLER